MDHEVSRRHAEIRLVVGEDYRLVDLHSANGTYLNDEPDHRRPAPVGGSRSGSVSRSSSSGPGPGEIGARSDRPGQHAPELGDQRALGHPPEHLGQTKARASSALPKRSASGSATAWSTSRSCTRRPRPSATSSNSIRSPAPDPPARLRVDRRRPGRHPPANRPNQRSWTPAGDLSQPTRRTNPEPIPAELIPKAVRWRGAAEEDERLTISKTIIDHVLGKGEGVITLDAPGDVRFGPGATRSSTSASARRCACRSRGGIPRLGRPVRRCDRRQRPRRRFSRLRRPQAGPGSPRIT